MTLKRREFLYFLGASAGAIALKACGQETFSMPFSPPNSDSVNKISFKPVRVPMPLALDDMAAAEQKSVYSTYEVVDDLSLPESFTYDLIAAWGDKIGDSRFGYNNDYLSFIATNPDEGFLTINFEYISGGTWMQTYPMVIGKSLPFEEVKAATKNAEDGIDAFALAENDPIKAKIIEISKEGLIDLGIGVISIRRNAEGKWERTYSKSDRRITGISGLEDGRYLKATGPAIAIFNKSDKKGYDDQLGDKIVGTFQNCAGGTTPWGTVLSAEENFQDQVSEPVMADGSSFAPADTPFIITDEDVNGHANVFGLAGNKYGWMVELDPANPDDYGTKHTWLGRYRHEAVAFRAVTGKPLAVYSGCDRRGGHLYKFVSQEAVGDIKDKTNSRLMEAGMLYGAKFNPDGTGRWIALNPDTTIDPALPSQVEGKDGKGTVSLPNPDRLSGGIVKATTDNEIAAFKEQFKTLGDLYEGDRNEKQGAILIDAHYAANAAGITCTARPEDTEVDRDGTLFIAFTSGTPDSDGGPDKQIFKGPNQETPYEFGWIMRLQEDNSDPSAITFRWTLFATGGEPAEGGLGFSNPDNLAIDRNGNIWMVTDMSTSSHNQAVASRVVKGEPVGEKELLGLFGNNSAWFIPTSGANAGKAYPFAISPMDTEICGLCFTEDEQTLFLAIQHPGEAGGMRQDMKTEVRQFDMRTTTGEGFMQQRTVPLGSNWPGKSASDPPRPAVVAIRRIDKQSIASN
jgi:uncharacterized protein